jgi:voltage-gated potassium channel Kch
MEMLGSQITKKRNPLLLNLNIYLITLFAVTMISSSLMYYTEGILYAPSTISEGQAVLDQIAETTGQPAEIYVPHDPLTGAEIPEDKRFFNSIPTATWWCLVTLTTTGYGDLYPVTLLGRIIAVFTMFSGLILFSLLMNIVGKTVMVMLFGETLDGHEKPAVEVVSPLGVDAVVNPVAAALALLQRENIISTEQAIVIAGKSRDELSRGLAAIAQ